MHFNLKTTQLNKSVNKNKSVIFKANQLYNFFFSFFMGESYQSYINPRFIVCC